MFRVTERLDALTGEMSTSANQAKKVLDELKAQEDKLVDAHLADQISPDVFAAHQSRLRRERATAERVWQQLTTDLNAATEPLERALRILTGLQGSYRAATEKQKQLINQGVFERIEIIDGSVARAVIRDPSTTSLNWASTSTCHSTASPTAATATAPGTVLGRHVPPGAAAPGPAPTPARRQETPASLGETGVCTSTLWYPQGESNPCYQRERLTC